jgi:hypothetical protein
MLNAEPIRRVIVHVSTFPCNKFPTQEERRFSSEALKGPNGRYLPVEEIDPLPEGSTLASGFHVPPPPLTPGSPPPVPPKANAELPAYFSQSNAHITSTPASHSMKPSVSGRSSVSLAQMTAVDRSRAQRLAKMEPHLQFMVGPLLRYDTVDENGLWRGAALIVSKCAFVLHR